MDGIVKVFQLPQEDPGMFKGYDDSPTVKEYEFEKKYRCIFCGEISYFSLDHLYAIFNGTTLPNGYHGHNLSVSDIVGIQNDSGEWEYHYCDLQGWKQVQFADRYTDPTAIMKFLNNR